MVDVVSAESPGVVPALIAHLFFYFRLLQREYDVLGEKHVIC